MMQIKVECPNCKCPLVPPAGSATGMTCPRCTTWLEFDARCTGGCLSCFKTRESKPTPCCDATESLEAAKGEAMADLSGIAPETEDSRWNLVAIGWKRLFQRLFAVR